MATALFVRGPLGAGPTRRTVAREFAAGMTAVGDDATSWTYQGPSGVAIAANGVVAITSGAAAAGTGFTAETAVAIGDYCFLRKTVSPF